MIVGWELQTCVILVVRNPPPTTTPHFFFFLFVCVCVSHMSVCVLERDHLAQYGSDTENFIMLVNCVPNICYCYMDSFYNGVDLCHTTLLCGIALDTLFTLI